ncbi:MAG: hypothetical protein LBO06_06675 [Bacteroidales bacterium]|nr:hypothetical protein [Bacteroidales bacterium]
MTKKAVLSILIAAGLVTMSEAKAQSAENSNNNTQKKEVKMIEKIKNGNKLIENGVVAGYKQIEKGVVSGYKSVEDGVVSGYQKVEDKCVETLFKKADETTEEAKIRLKKLSNEKQ